jgi:hypothetical protein
LREENHRWAYVSVCVLGVGFGESLERTNDNLIVFAPFFSSDKTFNYG